MSWVFKDILLEDSILFFQLTLKHIFNIFLTFFFSVTICSIHLLLARPLCQINQT